MTVEFEPYDGPLFHRPRNRREVAAIFGDPTRGGLYLKVADPKWVAKAIVEPHGDTAFLPVLAPAYFAIHRLVEPYAREAFRRAEAACPGYIQRQGTWAYNHRHMRHNPAMPLSMHSWGIAIDINPDDNRARKNHSGSKAPQPWDETWMRIWPRGMPEGVVAAFQSCGWSWGGRWRGYCDPMHWEWVGVAGVAV